MKGSSSSKPSEHIEFARAQLESMWRTSCMNRYFLPISKLPPLSPDPRPAFGNRPPACCPGRPSTTRTGRLMTRWASMPSMVRPSQRVALCPEGAEPFTPAWEVESEELHVDSESRKNSRRAECSSQGRRSRAGTSSSTHTVRHCAANGGRDFPFVPCMCCERNSPIPRITKLQLGDLASSLVAAQLKAAALQGGQKSSAMHVKVMEAQEFQPPGSIGSDRRDEDEKEGGAAGGGGASSPAEDGSARPEGPAADDEGQLPTDA
eukprot:TRINITY_DN109738_c0_g1_i1.p1 TRINITY_DN109738_c0_g1~~TRINITY_DN109738_c0_g1_i1.p1  ORF type:complete len:263 (-),score=49.88 TRINITY_DN109738_c0_g1_i1:67-855(-)